MCKRLVACTDVATVDKGGQNWGARVALGVASYIGLTSVCPVQIVIVLQVWNVLFGLTKQSIVLLLCCILSRATTVEAV